MPRALGLVYALSIAFKDVLPMGHRDVLREGFPKRFRTWLPKTMQLLLKILSSAENVYFSTTKCISFGVIIIYYYRFLVLTNQY